MTLFPNVKITDQDQIIPKLDKKNLNNWPYLGSYFTSDLLSQLFVTHFGVALLGFFSYLTDYGHLIATYLSSVVPVYWNHHKFPVKIEICHNYLLLTLGVRCSLTIQIVHRVPKYGPILLYRENKN